MCLIATLITLMESSLRALIARFIWVSENWSHWFESLFVGKTPPISFVRIDSSCKWSVGHHIIVYFTSLAFVRITFFAVNWCNFCLKEREREHRAFVKDFSLLVCHTKLINGNYKAQRGMRKWSNFFYPLSFHRHRTTLSLHMMLLCMPSNSQAIHFKW